MADPTQTVIEALYDVPLGGSWRNLQSALCGFWAAKGAEPQSDEIQQLERHFTRAMAFMERLPENESRWRNELFRIPVPACVVDRSGNLIDANVSGQRHLGGEPGKIENLPLPAREQISAALRGLQNERLVSVGVKVSSGELVNFFISDLSDRINAEGSLCLAVMVTTEIPHHGRQVLIQQFGLTAMESEL